MLLSTEQNKQQAEAEQNHQQQQEQRQEQEQQSEYHNYQWGQTHNAVTIFCSYYSYTRDGETAFDHKTLRSSAANRSIGSTTGCTITEKAPTRAFSWLKALSDLRHY